MSRAVRVLKKVGGVSKCKGFATPRILPQSLSSFSRLSFCSHSNSPPNQIPALPSSDDDLPADVPTEELKKRIDRYLDGDAEAIPSIFEAILARKLSGNHDDTDEELMEEFQNEVHTSDEDSSESDNDLRDKSDHGHRDGRMG